MSELRISSWRMPAADLGPVNPLPPLANRKRPQFENISGIPDKIIKNMTYGHVPSILPYMLQDGYSRQLHPTVVRVAVLENEILRATFLLEFGGRLWSLVHKPSGRELLEVNPVFQLANLAVRNAWFSGGVEFNVATIGHSPLTCSPVFASRLIREDGTPVLRLYEWERLRQTPYQIDAYLPDGSPLLFLRIRIINPNAWEVPMYWWTNIAVPHSSKTRVIVPAFAAYCLGCKRDSFTRIPIPRSEEIDHSYPSNIPHAADYFFHLPAGQRPWITALDQDGKGLVQASTSRLMGRKLWVWGTGTAGSNWQKFLSPPGGGYIEIQAGLTRTQLEHLPMSPDADWSWLEAYGLLQSDAAIAHGPDWEGAIQHVEEQLQILAPYDELEREYEIGAETSLRDPEEILQRGSGWGALERCRRDACGDTPLSTPGMVFDDVSLGDEQASWINLIDHGSFPDADPQEPPCSYIVGDKWRSLLIREIKTGRADNWHALLQLGVMEYWSGDMASARTAWERSLELASNSWAARNLAVLSWEQGHLDEATRLMIEALRWTPHLLPLAQECGRCLVEAGRTRDWLELFDELPEGLRSNGRIRLIHAQGALAENRLDAVARFFEDGVIVDDLREGETSLADLWFAYHMKRVGIEENLPPTGSLRARISAEHPLPEQFDFSLTPLDIAGE